MTEKNIGFVNRDVAPNAMFSFDHLRQLNPYTKNVTESCYNFDEDLFNNFEDGSNLDGYLQTEKYFKHIRQEILQDFSFKPEILDPCNELSLHLRTFFSFMSVVVTMWVVKITIG